MTSQRFSSNKQAARADLKLAFKSNIAPFVIMLYMSIQSFVIGTISTIMISYHGFPDWHGQALNKQDLIELLRESASVMLVSELGTESIVMQMAICGLLFAVFSFMFMMRKRDVNFFLSSPVDRRTLFKNRMIAAFSYMAIALFVPIVIDVIANIYFFAHPVFIIKMALGLFITAFIYCAAAFLIITIGMSLTHTLIEGVFFGGGLYMMSTAIAVIFDSLFHGFLPNYSSQSILDAVFEGMTDSAFEAPTLLARLTIFNPLTFCKAFGTKQLGDNLISQCARSITFDTTDSFKLDFSLPGINYYLPVIIWAIVCVALMLIARGIFINRRAENAGIHGINKIAQVIFTAEGCLGFASLFSYFNVDSRSNGFVAMAIISAVFLLTYLILISIERRRAIHDKKTYLTPVAILCVVLIICGSLTTGFFGYSTYTPKADRVKVVAVQGLPASIGINEINNQYPDFSFLSTAAYSTQDIAGVYTDEKDIEQAIDIISRLCEKGDKDTHSNISVMFRLKNGKEIYREYTMSTYEAVKGAIELLNTKIAYDELEYLLSPKYTLADESDLSKALKENNLSSNAPIGFTNNISYKACVERGRVYIDNLTDCLYDDVEFKEIKNTPELRTALYKDISSSKISDRLFSNEQELFTIKFSDVDIDVDDLYTTYGQYYGYVGNIGFKVYPSMTETINYLKSIGEYNPKPLLDTLTIKEAYIEKYGDVRARIFENDYDNYSYLFISDPSSTTVIWNKDDNCYSTISGGYYSEKAPDNSDPDKVFKPESKLTDANRISEYVAVASTYRYADKDDYLMIVVCEDKNNRTVSVPLLVPAESYSTIA